MTIRSTLIATAVALAVASGLTACGGGSDSTAGIGGTGITTTGTITGFGSIIVNGVHYDIDSAQIEKDGRRKAFRKDPNTDLRIGMLVTVKGVDHGDGTGTASEVIYRDEIQGPVSVIEPANDKFTVMGVDVTVDTDTRFSRCGDDDGKEPRKGMNLANDLKVNDRVEVSGYRTDSGIRATYVELKDASCSSDDKDDDEIKGTFRSDGSGDFKPVGTSSYLSMASFFDTGSGCTDPRTLQAGGFYELKGRYQGGKFCIVEAEPEDEHPGKGASAGSHMEMEGIVTSIDTAAQTLVLNNTVTVYYSSATVKTGLSAGVKVEVKGNLNSDGSINATEIEADD